jgi:1,4-alpha-glucan branching enzyme
MMLGPDDLWLFNEGAHTRLYEHLGAHPGTDASGEEGCWFGVWAPRCS